MEFRDLKRQYAALAPLIEEAVVDVLSGGAYIGGAAVNLLEERLASFVGRKYCISCANGTDALDVVLKVWGIGPGDAVLVPDFTFFSTAEVVAAEGAVPVFVDVDPITFNIDAADLKRKVDAVLSEGRLRPRAVIAVDLFGLPADFNAVCEVAGQYGLMVLEDGAQGFGGSMGGRYACSFGDFSTTSFFPAKPLGCCGDGGAIFTDDAGCASLARSFCLHGKGDHKYDNVRIGLNSRLDAVQAAILLVKLKAFAEVELSQVNAAADIYGSAFKDSDLDRICVLPQVADGFTSSWAQYTVKLPCSRMRDSLQSFLKDNGIPSNVYYPVPMHLQKAFEYLLPDMAVYGDCPAATSLSGRVLSLPMGPYITQDEIMTVVRTVRLWSGTL